MDLEMIFTLFSATGLHGIKKEACGPFCASSDIAL
jgi:hypothetical protein